MLGLSSDVAARICYIDCRRVGSGYLGPCIPQKMKCPSDDEGYRACIKDCEKRNIEDQELERRLMEEEFLRKQLKKERLRERSRKH